MCLKGNKAVTLFELLIAISLLSFVVLALSSIDLFSRHQVIDSGRRANLQNDVTFVLEHMNKRLSRAIGNERALNDVNSVVNADNIGADPAVMVHIDSNGNGQSDAGDRWIAYRFNSASHQIRFCQECSNATCSICNPAWGSEAGILSRRIVSFIPNDGGPNSFLANNFIEIQVTACWDASGSLGPCGASVNPSVTMSTSIKMPSVSTN